VSATSGTQIFGRPLPIMRFLTRMLFIKIFQFAALGVPLA
jgi:hypothetical protein